MVCYGLDPPIPVLQRLRVHQGQAACKEVGGLGCRGVLQGARAAARHVVTVPPLSSRWTPAKAAAVGAGKDSNLAPHSRKGLRLWLLLPRMGFVLLLCSGIGFNSCKGFF